MASRPHDLIQITAGVAAVPSVFPGTGKTVSLPTPLTRLIGRGQVVATVAEICQAPEGRLVTLTGPGGIGKTRIAIAAAHALVDRFDRLIFVPLVAVSDPAQVPDAIARRLGVREPAGGSLAEGLQTALSPGRSLLVLDNLEHVIEASGLVATLLQHCPDLHVLATSRVPLRIAGERECAIQALDLPDSSSVPAPADLAGHGAIDLFLERVRAFQPDFTLEGDRAADVAAICTRLDGLPLAIELAAARLRILSPSALRDRLGTGLAVLAGGGPDQAAHQRTMHSTIAWSYDLLSPEERALFRRLAVFAGTFDIEAAESLNRDAAAGTFDALLGLVNQNLVRREILADGAVRFRLLATIREFALETLAASPEAPHTWRRFTGYMAGLVEQASPHLTDQTRIPWSRRLELEQPNILAALQWLEDQVQVDALLAMLAMLQPFWQMRGQFEIGQGWLDRGIAAVERTPATAPGPRAGIWLAAGRLALARGDHDAVARYGTRAEAIARQAGDQRATADALALLGMLAHRLTDYPRARECATAALSLYEALGNDAGIAAALQALATTTMDDGDLAGAERLYGQAIDAFTRAGDAHGAAIASDNLSVARYSRNDVAGAAALAAQALEVFRSVRDMRRTAVALDHVGKCARRLGKLDEAWQAHRESLEIRVSFGDPRGLVVWLEAVAALLAERGDPVAAATLLGASDAARAAQALPMHGNEAIEHGHILARLEHDLGPSVLHVHHSTGRTLPLAGAIDLAVQAAGRTSPPPPAVDPLAPYNLTGREREVLDLVCQRLSDREIADALFISPRTVARHLAGLFAKLDVHSRREAADLARSLGAFPAT